MNPLQVDDLITNLWQSLKPLAYFWTYCIKNPVLKNIKKILKIWCSSTIGYLHASCKSITAPAQVHTVLKD